MFFVLLGINAFAGDRLKSYALVPKGEFFVGAQLAGANFSSADREFLLALDGMDSNASVFMFSAFGGYAYKEDNAIGLKVGFSTADANIDELSVNLLDLLQMDIKSISVSSRTKNIGIFHRSFIGLDSKGCLGFIYDASLSLNSSRISSSDGGGVADKLKAKLAFSPGLIFFATDLVSASFTIDMANVSYTSVKYSQSGESKGRRGAFSAKLGPDVLGLNLGIGFHF